MHLKTPQNVENISGTVQQCSDATTRGHQSNLEQEKVSRIQTISSLHTLFFVRVSAFRVRSKSTASLQPTWVHQLPLQFHWVFPSQAGGAVAASLAGADHLVALQGGDSLLDGRHQALHSQILNTVGPCRTARVLTQSCKTDTYLKCRHRL